MEKEDFALMELLKKGPMTFMALAIKLNGGQRAEEVWRHAEDLVHKGLLHHYAQTGNYGQFGLSDKGRIELANYHRAIIAA